MDLAIRGPISGRSYGRNLRLERDPGTHHESAEARTSECTTNGQPGFLSRHDG